MNTDNETRKFDCSRGCVVERTDEGELKCDYRQGCCKLEVYDWLPGVKQEQYRDYFEVRFKNTRKGIYVNASGQTVKMGDLVIVEAVTGHDLGIVTLEGPVVARQMRCRKMDPATAELKKIYRKAKVFDIEKWQEAIAREHETMIRARQIAAELELEMKIGDVEFQGDGTKAIFYYIADGRVDFRQLIKVFAEEFHIRIEMKQIGARQEAGLIGGLGVCGRELCCSNYISSFQSITTASARIQDLSLNPQKLAGQCGKLKCCLNYETAVYMDAQSRIPKVANPLEFEDGLAYLMKTDILKEVMYFSYDQTMLTPAGVALTIILMFIGASPGSTGGGVKTTSFFTAVKASFSLLLGRNPKAFKREISSDSIMKAFFVIIISVLLVALATLLLTITDPQFTSDKLLYEVVSAYATVGLTMGVTPSVSFAGKIILILMMFLGRVGFMTIISAFARKRSESARYIEEKVIIG